MCISVLTQLSPEEPNFFYVHPLLILYGFSINIWITSSQHSVGFHLNSFLFLYIWIHYIHILYLHIYTYNICIHKNPTTCRLQVNKSDRPQPMGLHSKHRHGLLVDTYTWIIWYRYQFHNMMFNFRSFTWRRLWRVELLGFLLFSAAFKAVVIFLGNVLTQHTYIHLYRDIYTQAHAYVYLCLYFPTKSKLANSNLVRSIRLFHLSRPREYVMMLGNDGFVNFFLIGCVYWPLQTFWWL